MLFPRNGSLRAIRIQVGLLLLLSVAGVGCSAGNTSSSGASGATVNHIAAPGASVPGWFVLPTGGSHGGAATLNFIANDGTSSCAECHGADLSGGISKVSCFANPAGCHHGPIPNWAGGAVHGAVAKKAPGNSGLASCQICHGAGFSGGGSGVSCFTSACHGVNAPHPAKPWRLTSGTSTHATTDPQNAPVCARCHAAGSSNNPAGHPSTAAPAGTAPGCYNNTLCHGVGTAPHALGATWVNATSSAFHGLTAKQDLKYCQGCHGASGTTQFNGGAASTSCQSATCHPQAKAHPTRWYQAPQPFPGYVSSHRNAGSLGVSCAICHKVDGPGTGLDNTAPSCYSDTYSGVTCHSGGPGAANHAIPFLGTAHTQVDQTGFDGNCKPCHAVTGTSSLSSAPRCTVCHKSASALPFTNCTSCHVRPPNNASETAYPNFAGRHLTHDNLAGVPRCTSCHNTYDSGTLGHYNGANAVTGKDALRVSPADVAFLVDYKSKAGNASFRAADYTCVNVSCHGGVPTPDWRNGTIGVNTNAGCLACHTPGTAAGTPENNSPFSGLHGFHLGLPTDIIYGKVLCTDCHNMANGTAGAADHFKSLNTTQMEGLASDTVANYNATNKTCSVNCHAVQHTDFPWQGGANHDNSFLDPAHTKVNRAGFDANCAPCHAETGSSPSASPPSCDVCHKAGSPLTTPLNCASCHSKPPAGPTYPGNYPDFAGKHAKHDNLVGAPGICVSCHSGRDTGSQEHYNRANARTGKNALRVAPGDVVFQTTFNAKGVTASFTTAFTCTNVSCHGGVAAPDWRTGTINSATDAGCRLCHKPGSTQGSPENNSYFSGMHDFHLSASGTVVALCTDCHDMTRTTAVATNHFKSLNTSQFEGPASETVAPLGVRSNYDNTNQTCTVLCHSHQHTATSWEGGASHVTPYLDNAHTKVDNAGFNGNCKTCHAVTGTSPLSSAPSCDVCHKAGSPLTLPLNCASCHANPPNNASTTAYPNVAGKHVKHDNVVSGTGTAVCGACHSGMNTGSQPHYDRANARSGKNALRVSPGDVVFAGTTYNAKTGGPARFVDNTSMTCAGVSCHGGQTAPNWQTGTISVNTNTGCRQCHVYGTTQYNGPTSSNHNRSDHRNQPCTNCHNMANGSTGATNHFKFLNTTALEGPAGTTVGGTGTIVTYTDGTNRCTPNSGNGCHSAETW